MRKNTRITTMRQPDGMNSTRDTRIPNNPIWRSRFRQSKKNMDDLSIKIMNQNLVIITQETTRKKHCGRTRLHRTYSPAVFCYSQPNYILSKRCFLRITRFKNILLECQTSKCNPEFQVWSLSIYTPRP